MEIAGAADPGRRRPQRAFFPDRGSRTTPAETGRALRGTGVAQRDPRIPAPCVMAGSRPGDGELPGREVAGRVAGKPASTPPSFDGTRRSMAAHLELAGSSTCA